MSVLTPRWKPVPFPRPCAPPGAALFDPVVVPERGLLIAGGPWAVTVFAIGERRGELFTVQRHNDSWITGFTVSAGTLYIQDGPVLLGYDLTFARLFAALNLVTGVCWPQDPDGDVSGGPPASIYSLAEQDQVRQTALMSARHAHARATLLSGNAGSSGEELTLRAATLAAELLVFSPPVVRSMQLDARESGQVFSLRMDGKVCSIDSGLREVDIFSQGSGLAQDPKRPLRPELVMAEIPLAAGNVRCHLYYVAADGSIIAINATGDLVPLPHFQPVGTVNPARVLPLRFIDGYLMGGGILGADFFVTELDPSRPPHVVMAAPPNGWRHYDVSVKDRLVMVSDGTRKRMACYDPETKQRERWPEVAATPNSWSMFWTGTGSDATIPGARLTLDVDVAGSGAAGAPAYRSYLANTVDAPAPPVPGAYPPPAANLGNGTFGMSAAFASALPRVAWFPCKPVIAQQTLYCVVRSTLPDQPIGVTVIAAFSLANELAEVREPARKVLAERWFHATALRLQITETILDPKGFIKQLVKNRTLTVAVETSPDLALAFDANGIACIDAAFTARHATLNRGLYPGPMKVFTCSNPVLERGRVNEMTMQVFKAP